MQRLSVDAVETVPHLMGANSNRRPISRAVEGMDFAMVFFELQPGEAFSGAPHKHLNQEELFYVSEGTATWTLKEGPGTEAETVTIGPNELIHFHEDDIYQQGTNDSDDVVRAISIGSPGARHEWEQALGLVDCPECGAETVHTFRPTDDAEDRRMPAPEHMLIECRDCGNQL
ncbi:cupin domain-containing protein [Halobaculum roseum]|uniref:Cupin domain-containing protein n=1 Tax=Halobaculum roseum TaxID=2175149 RepID=A0ABD5MLG8_9EURY|nr:cupin domain-containing protein [Halobaculum roseum]QZY01921.1 cupin domain-containing protein [Halobaculum roseum]